MFDPYNIYNRSTHKSHKGQVLQKRIPRYEGKAFTNEELEQAIPALRAAGYYVNRRPLSKSAFRDIIYPLNLGIFYLTDIASPVSLNWSDVWPTIKPDFESLLNIDPILVDSILFKIDVLSFSLEGQMNFARHGTSSPTFYFIDPNSAISFPQDTTQYAMQQNDPSIYSLSCYSDTDVLMFRCLTQAGYSENEIGQVSIVNKLENTDNPYLYTITRQQPAILTALRNDDYSVFNPSLINILWNGTLYDVPISIQNTLITFRVHLEYETR